MKHINEHRSRMNRQIAATFSLPEGGDTFQKSEEVGRIKQELDELEKGKKGGGDPIGTIKKFGANFMVKTVNGWKYHSKDGVPKHSHEIAPGGHVAHSPAPQAQGSAPHQPAAPAQKTAAQQEDETTKLAQEKMGDINFRFKMFATAVKGVIQGKFKSVIAYGTGGVGKTYTVTKQLDAAGKIGFDEETDTPGDDTYDYVKVTGKATPTAVYKALYEHNGKIILFDDCDSVLKNPDAVNFFKGALDTSGDGTIAYGSSKKIKDDEGNELPSRFKFKGRVIFISNLTPDEMPQPLKSRGVKIDLSMSKDQTIERIRSIATHPKTGKYQNLKFPGIDDYSHEDMKAVIDYLDKHKQHMSDLNVRTVGKILGLRQLAHEMGEGHDWEKYADQETFSKSDEYDILSLRKSQIGSLYKSNVNYNLIKSSDIKSRDYVEKGEELSLEKSETIEMLETGGKWGVESSQLTKSENSDIEEAINNLFIEE